MAFLTDLPVAPVVSGSLMTLISSLWMGSMSEPRITMER